MQWKWKTIEGKSAPQKVEIRGTIRQGVNALLSSVDDISQHLFRANWHRNIFDYIRANLKHGYILQVMDLSMNFNN